MSSTMDTTAADLESVLAAADAARRPLARTSPADRADALDAVAQALEDARADLVALAAAETHLPDARLNGELTRTVFQARLFAQGLRDGSLVPATVEHADPDWGMGPRPDIRRTVVPIGPVLVFAASNFPFAFSVFGGDSASAFAAGCPVVVKAHPGHPGLSRATAALVVEALEGVGYPVGAFALIEGVEASISALKDRRVKASGFTGSLHGGRALFDIASGRPDPIPFYGELGSVNPVVVTPAAWAERGADIVTGWVGSLTLGAGQFCTNPGVVLVPDAEAFTAAVDLPAPGPMLNPGIVEGFGKSTAALREQPGVRVAAQGPASAEGVAAQVLTTTAADVLADPEALLAEAFGPAGLVVQYSSPEELEQVLDVLPGQLTGSVQAAGGDDELAREVALLLAENVGRVVWNEWPTGVTVSAAQQHGGPWPATTAPTTTSVGLAAIERWQRPVAFQGVPAAALPEQLRD
ncbi:aldehyde dehydrogenase (NADP(+)) [Kineococcus rhizosphaerae]|uniref:NADP-dependent aldehyde dehydrogenase n=1 Tax=Kineococcus rhizosphaerae TaxID=559628 RepID=A0A2T0R1J2_9ACTN|nr:aldehyde dehydrogenase (NADP(+)) [Kineococcus rhizosphaerae]PRY13375.1 NADP-dependent aldehyde dehydrogenase [Kineococcus rhizosphaerae]